jgi:outer membrane protein OmpA-like peptidoglycan-associated protein
LTIVAPTPVVPPVTPPVTTPSTPKYAGSIYFAVGSWTLTAKDKASLAKIAKTITNAKATTVWAHGYADQQSAPNNTLISKNRATVIVQYLTRLVGNAQLIARWFGVTKLNPQGAPTNSLALNRRVDILYR